tara:strand:- start:96 stop:512 length:417 start_codon:yes stop_codon:yes gene_type:complete
MGAIGGFQFLSNGIEFSVKSFFGFSGMLIGVVIGIIMLLIINNWNADKKQKTKTILIYALFGIAPMIWAYFDFPENSNSQIGLITMLAIDVIALIRLYFVMNKDVKKLLQNLLIISIWQTLILFWFICITWKSIGYWD